MKINQVVIEILRKKTRLKRTIARLLDISEASVARLIRENRENGDLTKLAVLDVIKNDLKTDFENIIEYGSSDSN